MTKDEALRMALDALGNSWTEPNTKQYEIEKEAITAIKKALAQPEQEPVATVTSETRNPDVTMSWWHEPALCVGTKLYTTPPKREWIGLTDKEILKFQDIVPNTLSHDLIEFAQAIEASLKELNHD